MENKKEKLKRIRELEIKRTVLNLVGLLFLAVLVGIFAKSVGAGKGNIATMLFSFLAFVAISWALVKLNKQWKSEIRELKSSNPN